MKSYNQLIKEIEKPKEPQVVDISQVIALQEGLPVSIVRKGIKQGQLKINNKPIFINEIIYRSETIVTFRGQEVKVPDDNQFSRLDKFIKKVLNALNVTDSSNIPAESKLPFCCYLMEYFSHHSYDQSNIQESTFTDLIFHELEALYKDHFKETEKSKIPRRKEITDFFIKCRTDKLRELMGLVESLTNGVYNTYLYKFLQDYNRIIINSSFTFCIAPLISNSILSRSSIESLIKPIQDAPSKEEVEDKFNHWEKYKEIYSNYIALIDDSNSIQQKVFQPLVSHLFSLFKKECETIDIKYASIDVQPSPRRYNFDSSIRSNFDLLFTIKNIGEGLAREVHICPINDSFIFDKFPVGILKPDETRNVTIASQISATNFEPTIKLKVTWLNTSNQFEESFKEIRFQLQSTNVPWDELEKNKPYTIQEIEEKEKLYGRDEILNELKTNIYSNKIESFKIWGQKRVGKSSIVKTLKTMLDDDEKIIVVWRRISGLKNIDPEKTLNSLGTSLCSEIFEEIDKKIKNVNDRERLRSVEVPEFDGSLYPLEGYIKRLRKIDATLKFIFILDEFDGINEEFFLPGKLGDTLSQNMGKGLNESNYVGFLLVGSENMHLLDRQSMNYNNFKEIEVDTFDKETQFNSFKNIIIGPVNPFINYSNEAIELIFSVTSGNPYFANLICSHIFKICSRNKDSEVDFQIASKAISTIVNSSQKSHFDHFWSDGISEESNIKKERKTDIRRRILVGYSFAFYQNNQFPDRSEIIKNFRKPLEYNVENYEIENTINEFYNRKIFYDEGKSTVRIKPSLLESWLCGPGRTLMIEGISDLEALQREKQLEQEYTLKPEEIKRISESYRYRGHKIGIPIIEKYFNQFGSPIEQRRIFKIIDSIYYLSKEEVINFFKREQRNFFIRSEFKLKMGAKTLVREGIELYSFPETMEENIAIIESFKIISHIRSTKTLKDIRNNKDAWRQSESEDIIIFDSVIDDFSKVSNDLQVFLDDKSIRLKVPVKLVTLIITANAKADLIKATSMFPNFKLIHFKEIEENKIKPFIETTKMFETEEEAGYAYSEIRKHFQYFDRNSTNILLEEICPGKSLPILWCNFNNFFPLFPNEYARYQTLDETKYKEDLRTRLFHANTELSQALNAFIVNFLKESALRDGKQDWFHVDYIPPKVLTEVSNKWIEESQQAPKESYFSFIHYKEIIKKNKDIASVFQIGHDGLSWCDKLNILRRDPAHPEKPPPPLEDVEYFEKIKGDLLRKMKRT